ncbi:MAG: hypothetical protein ACO1RX_17395 [Candidatus Sericytochromatia bacterium]
MAGLEPILEIASCSGLSNQKCEIRTEKKLNVLAHEFFHYYQFGDVQVLSEYLGKNKNEYHEMTWFVEGSANWAGTWLVQSHKQEFALSEDENEPDDEFVHHADFLTEQFISLPKRYQYGPGCLSYEDLAHQQAGICPDSNTFLSNPYTTVSFWNHIYLEPEQGIKAIVDIVNDFSRNRKIKTNGIPRAHAALNRGLPVDKLIQETYLDYVKDALFRKDTTLYPATFAPKFDDYRIKPQAIESIGPGCKVDSPCDITINVGTLSTKHILLKPDQLSGPAKLHARIKSLSPDTINDVALSSGITASFISLNNSRGEAIVRDGNTVVYQTLDGTYDRSLYQDTQLEQSEVVIENFATPTTSSTGSADTSSVMLAVSNSIWQLDLDEEQESNINKSQNRPTDVVVSVYLELDTPTVSFSSMSPTQVFSGEVQTFTITGANLQAIGKLQVSQGATMYDVTHTVNAAGTRISFTGSFEPGQIDVYGFPENCTDYNDCSNQEIAFGSTSFSSVLKCDVLPDDHVSVTFFTGSRFNNSNQYFRFSTCKKNVNRVRITYSRNNQSIVREDFADRIADGYYECMGHLSGFASVEVGQYFTVSVKITLIDAWGQPMGEGTTSRTVMQSCPNLVNCNIGNF